MRTIKFLGFAVALAVVAVPAFAQGGLQPGAFPFIDKLARHEAQRIERRQQMRRLAARRAGRMGGAQRLRPGRGFVGGRSGMQGLAGGRPMGVRGFAAGNRARLRANATPEQKAFVEQFRAQRKTLRAQVLEGTLTREQARAHMQAWTAEHRPKK